MALRESACGIKRICFRMAGLTGRVRRMNAMYQAVQAHSMMDSADCRDVLKDTAGLNLR